MERNLKPLLVADFYCGAGGSSYGMSQALEALGIEHKLYAINHWDRAIATHLANYPNAIHRCIDLNSVDLRSVVPEGYLDVLWCSPSCVEHSYAKGGNSIDDQKRASAWAVVNGIDAFRPKIVFVENVKPFLNWGPLEVARHKNGRPKKDKDGTLIMRPIRERRGETYRAWASAIESLGYRLEWRVLNSADFGEAQTRERFFLIARSDGRRIIWPKPTHARSVEASLFEDDRQRWRAAREIIDLTISSTSIFDRTKPLAENTIERIKVGLRRFCSPAVTEAFLVILRKHADAQSIDSPVPTVTAGGNHIGLAQTTLEPFVGMNQSNSAPRSVDDPIPTVTASGGGGVYVAEPSAEPFVFANRFENQPHDLNEPLPTVVANKGGGGLNVVEPTIEPFAGANRTNNVPRSLDEPIPPVVTSGGVFVVEPSLTPFVIGQQSNAVARDVDDPLPTVATGGKISFVEPYLVEVNHEGDRRARTIEEPLPTITARNGVGMVEPFVVSYLGTDEGANRVRGTDEPLATVVTSNRLGLVEPFVVSYAERDGDGSGKAPNAGRSIDEPLATVIITRDRFGLVEPFVVPQQGQGVASVDEPLDTITTTSRGVRLVEPFLTAHFGEREGQTPRVHSIDDPAPTVTHRGAGDLVQPVIEPIAGDAPRGRLVEIDGKLFVLDIRFRMLQPKELARAQGFPDEYVFTGNKSEITAQIGNAVPTRVARALVEAIVPDVFRTRIRSKGTAA